MFRHKIDWNTFFQFILWWSFSPRCAHVQDDLLFLCIMHSDLFSCACPRWPIILSVCIYVFVFVYFERWSISPTSKMSKMTNRFATNFEIHWKHFSDKFQMENKFSYIPDVVLHPLNLICQQLHWAIWSLQKNNLRRTFVFTFFFVNLHLQLHLHWSSWSLFTHLGLNRQVGNCTHWALGSGSLRQQSVKISLELKK